MNDGKNRCKEKIYPVNPYVLRWPEIAKDKGIRLSEDDKQNTMKAQGPGKRYHLFHRDGLAAESLEEAKNMLFQEPTTQTGCSEKREYIHPCPCDETIPTKQGNCGEQQHEQRVGNVLHIALVPEFLEPHKGKRYELNESKQGDTRAHYGENMGQLEI